MKFISLNEATRIIYGKSVLKLIEPLNYFETHYWRFRQTYFFENN